MCVYIYKEKRGRLKEGKWNNIIGDYMAETTGLHEYLAKCRYNMSQLQ